MSALQALVNQTQAAANKKAAAKPATDKAASKASAKPAKGNGKASNKAETASAKPETQAADNKPAKAPKAEKAPTLRTVHVLKYTGADGQPASTNYTRFSRMVRDMRARLENGETCEIQRTKAPVETVIVDDGE